MANRFIKLLNKEMRHYDFQYAEGLNVDHIKFNTAEECCAGGLYYTDIDHFLDWFGQFQAETEFVADVTVPDGALTHAESCGTKWKASALVLSNIRPVGKFLAEQPDELLVAWIGINTAVLRRIEPQRESVFLAGLRLPIPMCWFNLYRGTPTPQCLLEAVRTGSWEHIIEAHVPAAMKTPEFCLELAKANPRCIPALPHQSPDMQMMAVNANPLAINDLNDPPINVIAAAIQQAGAGAKWRLTLE